MHKNRIIKQCLGVVCIGLTFSACKTPTIVEKNVTNIVSESYNGSQDSTNTGKVSWKSYFTDRYLTALIDTALQNNQELNITLQEIQIARNEISAKKGEYLPFVGLGGGAGFDRTARYTQRGASEATTEIKPGKEMPDPLPDFRVAAFAHWEVDIWHKLRNARKAAISRYLATMEGKNFMLTNIVAEIATSYYELLALDAQLAIIQQNIAIQSNALKIVRLQKQSTRVTELAVKRFEAQVLNTRSLQFAIHQQITVTENKINFLLGRSPQPVLRDSQTDFVSRIPAVVQSGVPSQLLQNRPDVRQAENLLTAAKIDISVARANFYPSLGISATLGVQAFNPAYFAKMPESLLSSLAGDLAGPLINKRAIRATYMNASAKQIQAVYEYEKTVLNAYIEVTNQLSNIQNLGNTYELKSQEVQALTQSTTIANGLFQSARADYMEVLLTQRDALESKFELVETKKEQLNATVNVYRALGGGWN
ncbi:NodT family efflux transporter outer membrane factor (OMF) lipoprotein [Dyadobacter jejuensis]|uniref:NodT family efflux transporter outer membrane factor (OMF) lipoprotein n=1 Tax=Dyadobacter jejuensis TaxID=1082580 RepID=A0A316APV1_9BACT|nr:TolC family protein [Dyadobacter jejuensis]PWJ59602.1 NodT family efflux transporter outer membrane factor (OMF) lipoprotein [Dyadobacter jejuensis]